MRTSRAILAVVLASIGFVALTPGSAAAEQRRVAVLAVEGARNAKIERSLRKIVKSEHVVVSDRVYRKAARRLKARQLNAEHVAEVAAYLEVDGVLEGTLHPERNGYKLTLRLRAGATGRPVKTYVIPVKANRFSERNADKLQSRLRSEISGLEVIGGLVEEETVDAAAGDQALEEEDYEEEDYEDEKYDEEQYDEEDYEARGDKARERGRRARRERANANRDVAFEADGDEDDLDADGADAEAADEDTTEVAALEDDDDFARRGPDPQLRDEAEEPTRDPYSRVVGLDVSVGPSFVARSLKFSSRASLADQVSEYSTVAAPGGYVAGEVFPLALMSQRDEAANHVGVGFRFEQAASFNSAVLDGDGNQIDLPSARRAYSLDVRYRLLLGASNSSPTLTVGVGYNRREYVVDRAPLDGTGLVIDLPNVAYTYFDPRATLAWPLSKRLALGLSGAFLVVTDAGAMTTPDTYGSALITGGDADVHVSYRVTDRIKLSVGAMTTAIAYDFNNDGELSANRDMDTSTEDVAGALDLYMGGYATLGFVY